MQGTLNDMTPLQKSIAKFHETLQGDVLSDFERDMTSLGAHLRDAGKDFDLLSATGRASLNELHPAFEQLYKDMLAVGETGMADAWLSEISRMEGGIYIVDKIRGSVKGLTSDIEALKKKHSESVSKIDGSGSGGGGGSDGPRAPGPDSAAIRQAIQIGRLFGQNGREILRTLQRRFPDSEAVGQDPGARPSSGRSSSRSRRRRRESRARAAEEARIRMEEEAQYQAELARQRLDRLREINMQRNLTNQNTVNELAEALGESPEHIREMLSSATGRELLEGRRAFLTGERSTVLPLLQRLSLPDVEMEASMT